MDITTLKKIIELYLKGSGYLEISKRTGVARSTVQDTVNKWKSGQTGIFDDALGYVDNITEIAKSMRQNGIKLEDLKMPFLNASVLRGLNIDLQDLYSLYDAIKDYGSDLLPEIAKVVIELQTQGVEPAVMVKRIESLGSELKEMEKKKQYLDQETTSIEAELQKYKSAKESLENNISALRDNVKDLRKQEKEILNQISNNMQRVQQSDRFWSAIQGMGIDPEKVTGFMEYARSMGYDARSVAILKEIEKFGLDRSMSPDDMRTLVVSLRQLTSLGWSPDSIVKLSIALKGVADSPDIVIEHMQKYTDRYHEVKKAIGIINRQLSDARRQKTDEIALLTIKVEELAEQIGKKQGERNNLESEISELTKKRDEAEASLNNAMNEFKKYTGTLIELSELQDTYNKLNQRKMDLDDNIKWQEKRLETMRISADIAESLPSIISGKDMKIRQFCSAIIAARNDEHAAIEERKLREWIVNTMIETSAGGVVPVHYSSYDRFISGSTYDELIKLQSERKQVLQEKTELLSIRELYGKDIETYLKDYFSGRVPRGSQGYVMIREIADKAFSNHVRTVFDGRAIGELIRERHGADSPLFMVAQDSMTGKAVIGSIKLDRLVDEIRSGSESVEFDTRDGKASLKTCDAILQLLEIYINPETMEQLRRAWREAVIDIAKKPDISAGMPRYGGLVNGDNMKGKDKSR